MYIFRRKSIYFLESERKRALEFVSFMRPKIALTVTGVAVSGYLLFNPLDWKLIFVILSSFFVTTGVYSFNLMTDREEDRINNRRLNQFVLNNKGYVFVALFLTLGTFFCLFLSRLSGLFYILALVMGVGYSKFKIKKVFPFKNFYAGFILPLTFFIGAAANSQISDKTFIYYLLISLYIFTISLISDLRDVRGDKASGIRTIPVVWGKNLGEKAIYFSLSIFFLSVISTKSLGLYSLLPFLVPVAFFIKMGNPKKAHVSSMTSFMFLPFGIFILKFFGGI